MFTLFHLLLFISESVCSPLFLQVPGKVFFIVNFPKPILMYSVDGSYQCSWSIDDKVIGYHSLIMTDFAFRSWWWVYLPWLMNSVFCLDSAIETLFDIFHNNSLRSVYCFGTGNKNYFDSFYNFS